MKRIKSIIATCVALMMCVSAMAVDIVPNPTSLKEKKGTYASPAKFDYSKVKTSVSTKLAKEEYKLTVTPSKITIVGGSEQGVFWGKQTLEQLIAQATPLKNGKIGIPCVEIADKPAFSYRGAHLDVSRHFFTVDEVKDFIDIMALHKLNMFHWHLTDDQGWRAEIKKYPRLTEVGSVRARTSMGHYRDDMFDGEPYGGFYTQEEMKEVVAYAAERFIEVIPEIEMPGHSVAALTAYPWLGCMQGGYHVRENWGIAKEVLCLGRETTYEFLEDVLDEIMEIFPCEYIHIGGDEAPHVYWDICPECQKVMKENGYTRPYQLQGHLVNRIEKYLNGKGRKLIGFDEILDGDISKTAIVMSWRGTKGGIEAAKRGNMVVMSPSTYYYMDYYQTADPKANGEPLAIGGHLNLKACYEFNPFDQLSKDEEKYIWGIQANTWTEYIATYPHIQHMVLPRFCALSENAWSGVEGKTSYEDFLSRVTGGIKPIYDARGYNYATYAFDGIE